VRATGWTPTRRRRPASLWGSCALLLGLAIAGGLAGGLEQPAFPAVLAFVAAGPLRPSEPARERAVLLAYGVIAWAIVGLAPLLTAGMALGGPYGGHPILFALSLLAAVIRVRVLRGPAMLAWVRP
jgi:hypothetical protein